MNKKFDPTEKNVPNLLKDLSADQKPYPKDLLSSRRAAYLAQVTSVVGAGSQGTKGNGQGGSLNAAAPMTPLMKAVLTALIAANVALAAYVAATAYENWDKIQAALFGAPVVSETSPASLGSATQLETTPEVTISPEESVTPDSTPEPTSPSGGSQASPDDESKVSTPEPDEKDNQGKHLGQTPRPTKEPPGQDDEEKDKENKK